MSGHHKIEQAVLFFLVVAIFISCNNKTHHIAELAEQPATYLDMGKLVIEKIKSGDYDELSGAWPDKVKYQVWSDYCHNDELDWKKMIANGTEFREHTSRSLKELLKGVPDKKQIVFKATHFYDRDKCREKFRSAGMLEIEFNIYNTTYALYCSWAVETIDGKVYLLDELLLNRPN
jgi:hypothetical protein